MIYERIATPFIARTMLSMLAAIAVCKAARWTGLVPSDSPRELIDFDAFYIAGQMAWRGDIADAYHFPKLMQAQFELGGSNEFMPWTYPPPFNLVTAVLATLPTWLSYLLFVGLTLAAFLAVLHRLSGRMFATVVIAMFPALATIIACGQNGFLTGTLIGLACLGLMRGHAAAGVPLGLMVIKPHLAVTFAFYVAVTRRWSCMLAAASVVAGCAGLATLAFGFGIWPAFLQGVREAGQFLVAGYYPLFRMVSIYAALRGLDVAPSVAMAAQGVSALAALAFVGAAIRYRMPTRQILGMTALCGLLVSPYAYDYDLSLYAVALALLMADLLRRTTDREQVVLIGLSWAVGGSGMLMNMLFRIRAIDGSPAPAADAATTLTPPSLAGPLLLLLIAFVWRILRREETPVPVGAAPDHPLSVAA